MKAKGKTPTPSTRSTSSRKQGDFERKLLERDGNFAVVGRMMEASAFVPGMQRPLYGSSRLIAAHVIPFSASSRPRLRHLLSIFAGQRQEDMETLLTGESINDTSNGILLDALSHEAFDLYLFGLECHDKHFRIRRLVDEGLLSDQIFRHSDGEEVFFGQGPQHHPLPSALFCNIHLAIGRVLHEGGVAGMIDVVLQDEDELNHGNMDGEDSVRVGASYLERELRGLQRTDDSGIHLQDKHGLRK
ncbi:hypothetical protein V1517DRAFT_329791 [Lipomyces orientalis]|uniref:Uncharacterized protein n=1 Tax=Lipomyces orientalis TaxID=1233043 RepID=A0ACC3THB5_9ASCO